MTITLARCSTCRRPLTIVAGRRVCGSPACPGHHDELASLPLGRQRTPGDESTGGLVCPGNALSRQDVEGEGGRRDLAFERRMLELAAMAAPVPASGSPFVADATARLSMGERAYGDRWTRQAVLVLLGELLEEAADLGAWGALCLQSLDGLTVDQREIVEACVLDVMRAGARAHAAVLCALGAVPPAGLPERPGQADERAGEPTHMDRVA